MLAWYRRRWLDLVASIYIYNEHRGYSSIDRVLAATYPDARAELDFDDAFQCLVVTVLSAQTTDKRVNAVRPALFAAYPDAVAMADILQSMGILPSRTSDVAVSRGGSRVYPWFPKAKMSCPV